MPSSFTVSLLSDSEDLVTSMVIPSYQVIKTTRPLLSLSGFTLSFSRSLFTCTFIPPSLTLGQTRTLLSLQKTFLSKATNRECNCKIVQGNLTLYYWRYVHLPVRPFFSNCRCRTSSVSAKPTENLLGFVYVKRMQCQDNASTSLPRVPVTHLAP